MDWGLLKMIIHLPYMEYSKSRKQVIVGEHPDIVLNNLTSNSLVISKDYTIN
jgi:hypothetical protein